jgi:hypothetical protein
MTDVTERAVTRFRRFLADLFPDEQSVARYREADELPDVDPEAELCADCLHYTATIRGRCFSCESMRGRAA